MFERGRRDDTLDLIQLVMAIVEAKVSGTESHVLISLTSVLSTCGVRSVRLAF
jgi:hypothetical protein